jgi:phosphoribosylformylglycinamidine synthase
MFEAKIHVKLKKSVLDPQGKTILSALHTLGFDAAQEVRVGKIFEIKLKGDSQAEAEDKVRIMCDKLLANPVIEEYSYAIEEDKKR